MVVIGLHILRQAVSSSRQQDREGLRWRTMGGNRKKKKHIQGACLKGQIPRPKLKSYR
jgi:hypothetical protein